MREGTEALVERLNDATDQSLVLEAIHLATADLLVASDQKITAFVTYDKRLAAAAVGLGLPVTAPGA